MRSLILGLALVLAACRGQTDDVSTAPAPPVPTKDAITKTTETGPVKTTLTVWPPRPALGDPIYARLEVTAPVGISVEAPFQQAGDDTLGRFKIVGFTRDQHAQPDGGVTQQQTYTLEAPSSGRHRVPPLRLEMLDARPGAPTTAGSGSAGAPRPTEIMTDEIPLEITPVKTDVIDAKLRPAAGTLDPTVGGLSWVLLVGIASVLAVLGSGSVLAFRAFRAKRRIQQQKSAYDEAVARLRELADRGAPGDDQTDRWFVELSSIVRRYLEHRYEIRAPELTTEEFLQAMTARAELKPDHRALLTGFMERCDRVKFAGYRPDEEESLASLASARGFVEDTRLVVEPATRSAA